MLENLVTNQLIVIFATSLVIMIALGFIGIPLLRKLHAQQSIRQEGPENHKLKAGTPTMGGIFILLSLLVTVLIFVPKTAAIWMLLLLTLGHGALGFFDDFIKTIKKRNLGLTAKQKLLGQLLLAGIFCYVSQSVIHLNTAIWIPFTNHSLALGYLYYPLVFLIIVGATNAVNLTDGLDGLAAGTGAIALMAYAVIALWSGMNDVASFGVALCGACIGFLYFNAKPAKVFMGDTGSLALGGALAGMAILTKTELLLILIGGVFVAEALSVIIQVISFKTRGVRVFKMSPVHHHFELSGWSEQRVVYVFWAIAIILAILGLGLMMYK